MDQPGWSACQAGLSTPVSVGSPGVLLSISLMNSDSARKHLFAQDVTRGGVGEWGARGAKPIATVPGAPRKAGVVCSRPICPFCSGGAWAGLRLQGMLGPPLWETRGQKEMILT